MKRRKQLLGVLLIAVLITGQVSYFQDAVFAEATPSVILDGRLLSFNVQPRNINDRVMVPYRAIGEAMGATIEWEEATRKVTMLLNDRYVILYTGNTMMFYGTHSINSNGEIVYNNPITSTLDAPPIIIEDYNFVPLRAIIEGLGAFVTWNETTNSVIITTPPAPTPTPVNFATQTPLSSPTPTPTVMPDIFGQTSWYQTISGMRAQAMYENNEQFILVYFSSEDTIAPQYLPELKQTAKNFGYKIYAVDARYEKMGANDLSFLWNYTSMYGIVYPLVFFINGKLDITYLSGPTEKNTLDQWFDTFIYKSRSAPATAAPTSGSGSTSQTPRPSASAGSNLNEYWVDMTRSAADLMYNQNEKFILVYYHSADDHSKLYLDTIKLASVDAGYIIYGCDAYAYGIDESTWWWGKSFVSNPSFMLYPTIFFVNNKQVKIMEQPTNRSAISSEIRIFMLNP